MPEAPEDLLAAVRDQAEVRLRMDVQGYASYLNIGLWFLNRAP